MQVHLGRVQSMLGTFLGWFGFARRGRLPDVCLQHTIPWTDADAPMRIRVGCAKYPPAQIGVHIEESPGQPYNYSHIQIMSGFSR